ncbi:MAG: RlmE family RNA methyltransferase [Spirochaetaceae bacterium]|jgi:23S rRNA (uridine2552-2'-O)-methyltransferase|nr:RlmE family RNA methyltransferase [Spirochaetaceae bacterium]
MNLYEKPDFWSQKAHKEGYPARSVYKLEEILRKFPMLLPAKRAVVYALDLGAAPGSWSLYLWRNFTVRLTACDLNPLDSAALALAQNKKNNPNTDFTFIQGDFCAPDIEARLMASGPYNLILSDAAPSTSGNHSLDSLRSHEIAETALRYAQTCLKEGGGIVIKIFQGAGSAALFAKMRGLFTNVKSFKPQACRANSVETYFTGIKRLSPFQTLSPDKSNT